MYFAGNEEGMGVSALRIAACAGVLIGALMLGDCAAGFASADPGGAGPTVSDEQPSKGVNNEHAGLANIIHRILSEHRRRIRHDSHHRPRVKFGSAPDSFVSASETDLSTFADANEEGQPAEGAGENERGADPSGTDVEVYSSDTGTGTGTDTQTHPGVDGAVAPEPSVTPAAGDNGTDNAVDNGSDYLDNAAVAAEPAAQKAPEGVIGYRYPLFWWQLRRGEGRDWWSVDEIMSSFQQVISPLVPSALRKPEPAPEPTPTIGPAFRGPAPLDPAPVLDSSGGVTGAGGSDYRATGFGAASVLSAPVVAAPPPAAARFPMVPAAAAPPPGVGSGYARIVSGPAAPEGGTRATVPQQQQSPAGTVKAMAGQTPRRGYTDYLRRPGLPQLAGAALPGVAGILLMTFAGGVIGHRQASAGRMIRASGAARYLP